MGDFLLDWFAHPQGDKYNYNLLPPGHYLGYLGALIAFVLPTMGSLSAGNYAL